MAFRYYIVTSLSEVTGTNDEKVARAAANLEDCCVVIDTKRNMELVESSLYTKGLGTTYQLDEVEIKENKDYTLV